MKRNYRQTYRQVLLENLMFNIKNIINHRPNYDYYIGVVKANAYNHGYKIIPTLKKGGINYLAVSSLEEALEIKKDYQSEKVLILEPIDVIYYNHIENQDIAITISSIENLIEWINLDKPVKIHLKFDTGMSRLGFSDKKAEILNVIKLIEQSKLELEGIYSHIFASSSQEELFINQLERFKNICCLFNNKNLIIHLGGSKIITSNYDYSFINGVRIGILMYGYNLDEKNNQLLELKPAMGLYSEVLELRVIEKGTYVGYDATYQAKEKETIATIPIGYYDGILDDTKEVVINNNKYPIVGLICMDMLMVKVDEKVKIKDKVEIFGTNKSMMEYAKDNQTNVYKAITRIGSRVYLKYDQESL